MKPCEKRKVAKLKDKQYKCDLAHIYFDYREAEEICGRCIRT